MQQTYVLTSCPVYKIVFLLDPFACVLRLPIYLGQGEVVGVDKILQWRSNEAKDITNPIPAHQHSPCVSDEGHQAIQPCRVPSTDRVVQPATLVGNMNASIHASCKAYTP